MRELWQLSVIVGGTISIFCQDAPLIVDIFIFGNAALYLADAIVRAIKGER